MSEAQPSRQIGCSILAVIAGILAGVVLSLGTDEILHVAHLFPPWGASMTGYDGALLLATFYRTIYDVAGSYITAALHPAAPCFTSGCSDSWALQ